MKPYYILQGILGALGILLAFVYIIRIFLEFLRGIQATDASEEFSGELSNGYI